MLGEEHPETLTSMNNLAVLYRAEGKYPQAEPLYMRVVEVQRRVLGADHPNMLLTMNGLALLYGLQGKNEQAGKLYAEVSETQRRVLGEEHPDTIGTISNLAVALREKKAEVRAGRALLAKRLDVRRRVLGEQHPDTSAEHAQSGLLYVSLGQACSGGSAASRGVDGYREDLARQLGTLQLREHPRRQPDRSEEIREAEPLVTAGYEALVQRQASMPAGGSTTLMEARKRIARLYQAWGNAEKAALWSKAVERAGK